MTISIGGGLRNFAYPAGYTGPARNRPAGGAGEAGGASDLSRAIDDLMAEAAKTPAERARDAVLKRHGIDAKGYAALDASTRKSIDAEIAEAVKRTTGTRDRAEGGFSRMA